MSNPFNGVLSFSAIGGDGHVHVYLSTPSNGIVQLTSGAYDDETPEWSFDGTMLTFVRNDVSTGLSVQTMLANGANLTRLSPVPGVDLFPAWHPNGNTIVFSRIVGSPNTQTQQLVPTSIMTMAADGTDVTTVFASNTANPFNMEPRFSPDGTKIAFTTGPHGPGGSGVQIATINADGTGLTYLTNVAAAQGDPHWSYDGTKLVFGSARTGNLNLYSMSSTDGSSLVQLTSFASPEECGDAGWSSNGSYIAFLVDVGGNLEANQSVPSYIWLMNSDGSSQVNTGIQAATSGGAPRFQPTYMMNGIPVCAEFVSNGTGCDVYIQARSAVTIVGYQLSVGAGFNQVNGLTLSTSATRATGQSALTFTSPTGVLVGQSVYGLNVPRGAVVSGVSGGNVSFTGLTTGSVSSGAPIYFETSAVPTFIEVQAQGYVTNGAPTFDTTDSVTEGYVTGPNWTTGNFGSQVVQNPAAVSGAGSIGAEVNIWFQENVTTTNLQPIDNSFQASGLNIAVAAGQYIVLHFDTEGIGASSWVNASVDVTGVIFVTSVAG